MNTLILRGNQCNIVGWAERSEAQHPHWVALRLTQPTKRYFNYNLIVLYIKYARLIYSLASETLILTDTLRERTKNLLPVKTNAKDY